MCIGAVVVSGAKHVSAAVVSRVAHSNAVAVSGVLHISAVVESEKVNGWEWGHSYQYTGSKKGCAMVMVNSECVRLA